MKVLLLALMCLSFTGASFAQEKPVTEKKAKTTTGPKFKFKGGETYDFGKIPEGPAAEHEFEFKNTGDEPLVITNASASCGCTTPVWPKQPILPGKTGKIKVRYNTQGRGNQPFLKSIYISSNVPHDKERYELFIKGFVTPADPITGSSTH